MHVNCSSHWLIVLCVLSFSMLFSCVDTDSTKGEQAAKKYCGNCHQFPEPALLNKTTWANYVLPGMGSLLGFRHLPSGGYAEYKNDPQINLTDWNSLVRYYISNAPETLAAPKAQAKINLVLTQFEVRIPSSTVPHPSTTMVCIGPDKNQFYFGDGFRKKLYRSDASGLVVDSIDAGTGVIQLLKSQRLMMLNMGVLHPSDEQTGTLSIYDTSAARNHIVLDSLQRPVHASFVDLNNDNREDILVAEFGNKEGRLAWYEETPNGKYLQHILTADAGAVQTAVGDYNTDGKPDILVLMAQGNEGVFVYYNQGGGKFMKQQLISFPPVYGSNSFQLVDINKDGAKDLVITNGDNGDYPPVLKPYHGIRIFLNDGHFAFKQAAFLPVNGVGKVIARDFDVDGDTDLVSIAYFPDYENNAGEGFIYWESKGNLSFTPSSFKQVSIGRWLTMDAGDIDSDGDIDIILGNAYFTLGYIPPALKKQWDRYSPSVILLINTRYR